MIKKASEIRPLQHLLQTSSILAGSFRLYEMKKSYPAIKDQLISTDASVVEMIQIGEQLSRQQTRESMREAPVALCPVAETIPPRELIRHQQDFLQSRAKTAYRPRAHLNCDKLQIGPL